MAICFYWRNIMKIGINNIHFKGVTETGFVSFSDPHFITKIDTQIKKADDYANTLNQQNRDTFVVKSSDKDALGRSYNGLKTYVLTDNDAIVPKQFDGIKKRMVGLFRNDLSSDLFTKSLDNQLDNVSRTQENVAKFIAENRPKDVD